jgi:hypothetical protein
METVLSYLRQSATALGNRLWKRYATACLVTYPVMQPLMETVLQLAVLELHQDTLFVDFAKVSGFESDSSRFALKHFFVDFARVSGFESDSSRFALKHFFIDFARVSGFESDSSRFALKHFYAQKGR